MCESQPVASIPVIATTEWIQAIRHFCHHERMYDGPTANAWLVGAGLLVPSSALIRSVLEYVFENREDIPFGTLPPSWVVKQLEQAGLISHRCAAVLHFQDQNYRFSTVVRIDPKCIWPDERLRPEAFITSPVNSLELRVLESLATPNARRRGPSPVRLAILVRASTTTPSEHAHPTVTPPALHAVLATYPELAFAEWFPVAGSSDA